MGKVNYNPPDGWLLNLKPGDCVWDTYQAGRMLIIKEIKRLNDNDCRVFFENSCLTCRVDYNGSFGYVRDLLPVIKDIPDDAGDGE